MGFFLLLIYPAKTHGIVIFFSIHKVVVVFVVYIHISDKTIDS